MPETGTAGSSALPLEPATMLGLPAPTGWRAWIAPSLVACVIIGSTCAIFGPLIPEAKGIAALVLMLGLIFARVPLGVALAIPGLLGISALRGTDAVSEILASAPYNSAASWSLSVVPLFIFMGTLLWRAGITDDLFRAGELLLGRKPGGLAVATNVAGAGLSAVTGTTIATTYTLAQSALPGMLRAGYSPRVALASVMAAGLPGQLIPPSILLVIYAGLAEVPVGPQLIAGVVPGLLFTVGFSIVFVVAAILTRGGLSQDPAFSRPGLFKARLSSLVRSWPIVPVMAIVIGGMYGGLFTATEAAAVASLVSILVTFGRRGRRTFGIIAFAARDALVSTGAIFLLVFGAEILSLMVTVSRAGALVTDYLTGLGLTRVAFLLVLLAFFLVLGMFMDTLAMMLVTVPLLVPVLNDMDISLIWFGVYIVIVGELALLTPPVGILSYVLHGLAQDPEINQGHTITLKDVFVAVAWTMPVSIFILVVLIAFPGLGTITGG